MVFKRFILAGLLLGLAGCKEDGQLALESHSPSKIKKVYAYAGAQYSNKIYEYALNRDTGELTALSSPSIDAQTLPMINTVTRDKKYLVTINYSSNSVSSYSINWNSGALTLVEHQALAGGSAPAWVVAHPSLDVLYVADSGTAKVEVLDINPSTGDLTSRGLVNAGAGVTALAINANGTVLYSADQNANQVGIYSIDSAGDLSLAGTQALAGGSLPNQLALSPNGQYLYVANWGTQNISQFSVSGTSLTSLGADVGAGGGGVYTVTVTPDGKSLIANKPYGNAYSVHSIDPSTGALGAANPVAQAGAVNFAFYEDFAYMVPWTSNALGLSIETRAYTSGSGTVGAAALYSAPAQRGFYQLTIVEVEVDP